MIPTLQELGRVSASAVRHVLTIVRQMLHSITGHARARRASVGRNAFDERRATQMAVRFLSLAGGKMRRIDLVKHMYIADRESMRRWGYPLVWDEMYSLDNGPVQSCVLSLAQGKILLGFGGYWQEHIECIDGTHPYCVLLRTPKYDRISKTILALIDAVYAKYRGKDIVAASHAFPEHKQPPRGGRLQISYEEVLARVGRSASQEEAARIELHSHVRSLLRG